MISNNTSRIRDTSRIQKFTKDLNTFEIDAVLKYKDLNNPQSKWDYKLLVGEKPKDVGMNCFMINGNARNKLLQPLTAHDKKQAEHLASLIHSAIKHSQTQYPLVVYRGYTNPEKMAKRKIGDSFIEDAFTSTSESKECAEGYATKNPEVLTPIVSVCVLPPRTNAIYLGKEEHEWLLQKGYKFSITNIVDDVINGKQGLLYYLRKEI